jgi:hypothetical protein
MAKGDIKTFLYEIPSIVKAVLFNPAAFFKNMPESGGYVLPMLFIGVMSVAGSILISVVTAFSIFDRAGGFGMYIVTVLMAPIFAIIVGFIWAAVVLGIWKVMGCPGRYRTAFFCVAYIQAISPIVVVLKLIPYFGQAVGFAWMTFLLVTASRSLYGLAARRAWIVFGSVAVMLFVLVAGAQYSKNQMKKQREIFNQSAYHRKMN